MRGESVVAAWPAAFHRADAMARIRPLVALLPALAALALVASLAWPALHNGFMEYDDEGYVAYSVAQYRDGLRLYDDVFSQYGPFAFVAADLAFDAAGAPVTTDAVRFATWLALLATLGALGALAWRLTGTWWAPVLVPLCGVEVLRMSFGEPFHPGHLIAVVLGCGALGVAWAWERGRPGLAAVVAGVAAGALLLTKVNVGVFWMLGAGAVAVQALPVHPAVRWAWFVGWVASPWLLMAPRLEHASVLAFAAGTSLGFLALQGALRRQVPHGSLTWSAVARGAAACVLTILVVCAVPVLRGTSVGALVHAVLVQPFGQTEAWAYALPWRAETAAPFVVGLLALAAAAGWRGTGLAAARLAAGVAVVAAPLLADWWVTLQIGLGAAALAVAGGGHGLTARVWIAALAQAQVLHAYPVAGSQVGWGSLLLLPVAVVLIRDGLEGMPVTSPSVRRGVRVLLPACLVGVAGVVVAERRAHERAVHADGLATDLPGAARLRLPAGQHALWSVLAANAAGADALLSLPGLGSLHLWSGTPPPGPPHATQWWALLDADRQQRLRRGLDDARDPLVVAHQRLLAYVRDDGFGPRDGLAVEVLETWPAYARFHGVELRSREPAGRPVVQLLRWDGTGWVATLPPGRARRIVFVRVVTVVAVAPNLFQARSLPGLEQEVDGRWIPAELPVDVSRGVRLRLPPHAVPDALRAGEAALHLVGEDGEVVPVLVDELAVSP